MRRAEEAVEEEEEGEAEKVHINHFLFFLNSKTNQSSIAYFSSIDWLKSRSYLNAGLNNLEKYLSTTFILQLEPILLLDRLVRIRLQKQKQIKPFH